MVDNTEMQLTKATSTILLLELALEHGLTVEYLKEVIRVYKEYQLKQIIGHVNTSEAIKMEKL